MTQPNSPIISILTQGDALYHVTYEPEELIHQVDMLPVTSIVLWQVYDPADEATLPRVDPECVDIEQDTGESIYHATVDVLVSCQVPGCAQRCVMGYYSYRLRAWLYASMVSVPIANVTHWAYIAAPTGGRHV